MMTKELISCTILKFADHVVLISIAILISLFSIQRFGTEKVSYMFAPCVTVWFAFIASIGIYNIFKYDVSIFRAFNPYYIIDYFQRNGKRAWLSLGGIVLAITGWFGIASMNRESVDRFSYQCLHGY